MKNDICIIVMGILCMLQSCTLVNNELEANLDAAEMLMNEHPDSSLAILNKIVPSEIVSRSDKARYALLYTQAQDKNFIDETDIALIREAKAHYEDTDDTRRRFLSLYYYGRVLYNKGDYAHAMIAYTEAENLIVDLNDSYAAGLLYTGMGNIYRAYCDYSKSLSAFQTAYNHYESSSLDFHKAYALLDIGIAYWNLDNTALAEKSINRSLQLALNLGDESLELVCYKNLVALYNKMGELDKCGNVIDKLSLKFDEALLSPACLGAIANYNAENGEYGQAESYLQTAWKRARTPADTLSLLFQSAYVMKNMGNSSLAFSYFEKGMEYTNRQLCISLQQPILSAQKEYFENQAKYNSYRLKKNTQIYAILFVSVLLFLVVVAMYVRQRMLVKSIELSRYMDLVGELQASLKDKDTLLLEYSNQAESRYSQLNEMADKISNLFRKQYELLDKLSNTFYEGYSDNREKDKIYAQVKAEINKLIDDKKTLAQLENIVNTYKRNVVQLIRTEIPNISDRDVKLLCYIYAGFSSKSISVFIGETTGNIITRKYRLRAKITKLQPPNMEIMLQEMP